MNRYPGMMMKVRDLGTFIREQRRAAQLSVRKLASLAGVSNPYLSQIERGLRRPSAEILNAIAKGLRISAETLYVKAGILDDREERRPADDLVTSILGDRSITESQKQVLVQIYTSFREDTEQHRASRRRSARRTAAASPGSEPVRRRPGGRVETAG
jgi:transcriptional regulator with XRE-family HTH domain